MTAAAEVEKYSIWSYLILCTGLYLLPLTRNFRWFTKLNLIQKEITNNWRISMREKHRLSNTNARENISDIIILKSLSLSDRKSSLKLPGH